MRKGLIGTASTLRVLAATMLASGTLAVPLVAQTAKYELPEKLVDQNSVDLASAQLHLEFPLLSFGDQVRLRAKFKMCEPTPTPPIDIGDASMGCGNTGTGSIIPGSGSDDIPFNSVETPIGPAVWENPRISEVTMPDGRAYMPPAGGHFFTPVFSAFWSTPGYTLLGIYDENGDRYQPLVSSTPTLDTSLFTFADGEIWTIRYEKVPGAGRTRSVTSNRGYMLQYEYEREAAPTDSSQIPSWGRKVKLSGGSLAYNYCDLTTSGPCAPISAAGNSISITYLSNGYELTHASGLKKRFEVTSSFPVQVTLSSPGSNSQFAAVYGGICGDKATIASTTRDGKTWAYQYSCFEGERSTTWGLTRTDPLGKTFISNGTSEYVVPTIMQDELLRINGPSGDTKTGYSGWLYPEQNSVGKDFDNRLNLISVTAIGKSGGVIRQNVATYDAQCSNLMTCNKPNTVTDALGNTTTYTYDPTHGGVLTKTGPAVNGVTQQTRYEYAQRYAWLKNASGGYSQASSPIWVLVRERYCRTTNPSGSSCVGGSADEVITDYDYGPNSGPNNLLLRGVAVTADGQTRRSCYAYDQMGRKISETKPAAGLASCP